MEFLLQKVLKKKLMNANLSVKVNAINTLNVLGAHHTQSQTNATLLLMQSRPAATLHIRQILHLHSPQPPVGDGSLESAVQEGLLIPTAPAYS